MLKARLNTRTTDRILGRFSAFGLHPIAWSIISIPFAAAGLLVMVRGNLAAGLIFFVLSGAIDMVDGAVARTTGTATAIGAYLDGIFDRYVEIMLMLGLLFILGDRLILSISATAWLMVMLFGSLMTSFVRAYADHRKLIKDEHDLKRMGGLLERAERLILIYAGMALGLINIDYLCAFIVLVAVLSNATAVQRIFFAVRYSRKNSGPASGIKRD
jgi:phosphatidylglycerophosphate synthase